MSLVTGQVEITTPKGIVTLRVNIMTLRVMSAALPILSENVMYMHRYLPNEYLWGYRKI